MKIENYPFFWNRIISQWKPRAKSLKITAYNLAEKADITREQFSNIINGKIKNPRISTINKVEVALQALEDESKILEQ